MVIKIFQPITRVLVVLFMLTLYTFSYFITNVAAVEVLSSNNLNIDFVGQYDGIAPSDIAVRGNYAYVLGNLGNKVGLGVIDVSNPISVSMVSSSSPSLGPDPDSLVVVGDFAYALDYNDGLTIINISNPTTPSYTGGSYLGFSSEDITVIGNYAYIVGLVPIVSNCCLSVFDISNPTSPLEIGYYCFPYNPYTYLSHFSLYVSGNYAYLAEDDGLRIIDVSNSVSPFEVGFYSTPYALDDIAVSGGYAYVATRDVGLRVIDVSNPVSPYEVGFYSIPYPPKEIIVIGNYAYVADGGAGLRVIDISNPHAPSEIGFLDEIGFASDIAVSGNYVYLSDNTRMVILHVIPPIYLPLIRNNYSIYFQGQWEQEDNDDISHANGALRFGQSYYGYHDDPNDYFGIYLPGGGRITADLTSQQDIKDGNGYYVTQLLLLDSNGRRLTYDDGPAAHLSYTASAGGWYYVRVFTNPDYLDSTKQYTLQVVYP